VLIRANTDYSPRFFSKFPGAVIKRWLIVAGLSIHTSSSLLAQGAINQLWVEYMLNCPIANVYNLETAFTYSSALEQPRWRSADIQATLTRSFSDHIDIQGSLYTSRTFQNEKTTTSEIREMLGIHFHFTPHSRVLTRLLVRFEQRNLKDVETNEWTHSTRSRLRFEMLAPINRDNLSADKLWYALADAEVFIVMDQDVHERYANRYRLRSGIGYRPNYSWRFEFVYTLQKSKNTLDGDFYTSDNLFRFRIRHYLNKSRPTKSMGNGN
jgi:hypothetical protein